MSYRLSCKREKETDSAVLIHDYASQENLWIPLSQVESMHFDKNGDGEIVMSDWIAQKKGLL